MKKILLLNGPPYSGKDTMADWFEERGYHHAKFSKLLKERTHALYGMPDVPYDAFEGFLKDGKAVKDMPIREFYGISPRDAYIYVSEKLMKPVHGDDIWARMLADELDEVESDYVVISDLGFQVEWETFITQFGYERLSVVALYRAGCSFENDSRRYILPRGPWEYLNFPESEVSNFNKYIMSNAFDIENGGTLQDLYDKCDLLDSVVRGETTVEITGQGRAIGSVPNGQVRQ